MLYLCGVNAAKAIKQRQCYKHQSPCANSAFNKRYNVTSYNYGNSNKSNPHLWPASQSSRLHEEPNAPWEAPTSLSWCADWSPWCKQRFCRSSIGSEALQFIKGWFFSSSNKTGCRFVIVDAVNEPQVIAFYEKNDFHCLFSSEEQEFLYTGGKKGQPAVLNTRLMYYDLLEMRK